MIWGFFNCLWRNPVHIESGGSQLPHSCYGQDFEKRFVFFNYSTSVGKAVYFFGGNLMVFGLRYPSEILTLIFYFVLFQRLPPLSQRVNFIAMLTVLEYWIGSAPYCSKPPSHPMMDTMFPSDRDTSIFLDSGLSLWRRWMFTISASSGRAGKR